MSTNTIVRNGAQIQQIGRFTVEFQPAHLFCDDCWQMADSAYAEAILNGCTDGSASILYTSRTIDGVSALGTRHHCVATIIGK